MPATLEQWIALNDEIASLARAGLPLATGLGRLGRDLPGRLGSLSGRLAERLTRGESLPQALAGEERDLPPAYAALVQAGIKSGRLPAALEGFATLARNLAELRRAATLALVYPLIVLSLAYVLFIGFVLLFVPVLASTQTALRLPSDAMVQWLMTVRANVAYWAPIGPGLLVIVIAYHWGAGRGWWRGLGWGRAAQRDADTSGVANVLALLIEHEIPLPEALTVTARCAGDRVIRAVLENAAGTVAAGRALLAEEPPLAELPPLLAWGLTAQGDPGVKVRALRHAAAIYRSRAVDRVERLRVLIPVVLLLLAAAVAITLVLLTVFIPLSHLWNQLAIE